MSKQMSLEIEGYKLFFQQYGIEDLTEGIDIICGVPKEKVQEVVLDFYKAMCEDLILNNNCFYLPERNFGMIRVGDITDVHNKDYKYDFETNGKVYRPIVRKSGTVYESRFIGAMKELFDKEVFVNQHKY